MEASDRSFIALDVARRAPETTVWDGRESYPARPTRARSRCSDRTARDYFLQPVSLEAAVTCLPLMPTTFGNDVPLICERITDRAEEPQTSGRR